MSKRLANFCIGALAIAVMVLEDMERQRMRRAAILVNGTPPPYYCCLSRATTGRCSGP